MINTWLLVEKLKIELASITKMFAVVHKPANLSFQGNV